MVEEYLEFKPESSDEILELLSKSNEEIYPYAIEAIKWFFNPEGIEMDKNVVIDDFSIHGWVVIAWKFSFDYGLGINLDALRNSELIRWYRRALKFFSGAKNEEKTLFGFNRAMIETAPSGVPNCVDQILRSKRIKFILR